eukprot:6474016-Amphidinium_carterae.1
MDCSNLLLPLLLQLYSYELDKESLLWLEWGVVLGGRCRIKFCKATLLATVAVTRSNPVGSAVAGCGLLYRHLLTLSTELS